MQRTAIPPAERIAATEPQVGVSRLRRRLLSPRGIKWLLTAHVIFAVGLLGDSAGYLAVAIRGATTSDPAFADASFRMLRMFALLFGIPLSFAALGTGILLGLSTRWGVLRYPWVVTKLVLILSVIAVGALVLKGGMDAMIDGPGGSEGRLIAGATYDVVALAVAAGLGIFKPGKPWVRKGSGAAPG